MKELSNEELLPLQRLVHAELSRCRKEASSWFDLYARGVDAGVPSESIKKSMEQAYATVEVWKQKAEDISKEILSR